MDPDFAQRRRFLVAVAITLVLVPGAFLLNRSTSDDDNTSTPIGTLAGTIPVGGTTVPGAVDDAADDTDALGTIPVGYLQGTVTPNTADAPMIAIPRPDDAVEGRASFSHDIDVPSKCIIENAPNAARVTVTNLDNRRSVQCINTLVAPKQPYDVMLSTQSFLLIADLTDAPVYVEMNW